MGFFMGANEKACYLSIATIKKEAAEGSAVLYLPAGRQGLQDWD